MPKFGVLSNLNLVCTVPLEVVKLYLSKILNVLFVQAPEVSVVQLEPSVLYSTVTKSPSVNSPASSDPPKAVSGI